MSGEKTGLGAEQPGRLGGMTAVASEIAISEMSGFTRKDLCGYIVIAIGHRADGRHETRIMAAGDDKAWAAKWLARAAETYRRYL